MFASLLLLERQLEDGARETTAYSFIVFYEFFLFSLTTHPLRDGDGDTVPNPDGDASKPSGTLFRVCFSILLLCLPFENMV